MTTERTGSAHSYQRANHTPDHDKFPRHQPNQRMSEKKVIDYISLQFWRVSLAPTSPPAYPQNAIAWSQERAYDAPPCRRPALHSFDVFDSTEVRAYMQRMFSTYEISHSSFRQLDNLLQFLHGIVSLTYQYLRPSLSSEILVNDNRAWIFCTATLTKIRDMNWTFPPTCSTDLEASTTTIFFCYQKKSAPMSLMHNTRGVNKLK